MPSVQEQRRAVRNRQQQPTDPVPTQPIQGGDIPQPGAITPGTEGAISGALTPPVQVPPTDPNAAGAISGAVNPMGVMLGDVPTTRNPGGFNKPLPTALPTGVQLGEPTSAGAFTKPIPGKIQPTNPLLGAGGALGPVTPPNAFRMPVQGGWRSPYNPGSPITAPLPTEGQSPPSPDNPAPFAPAPNPRQTNPTETTGRLTPTSPTTRRRPYSKPQPSPTAGWGRGLGNF